MGFADADEVTPGGCHHWIGKTNRPLVVGLRGNRHRGLPRNHAVQPLITALGKVQNPLVDCPAAPSVFVHHRADRKFRTKTFFDNPRGQLSHDNPAATFVRAHFFPIQRVTIKSRVAQGHHLSHEELTTDRTGPRTKRS